MALIEANKRYQKFGAEAEQTYVKNANSLLTEGRITLVEHSMAEALFLSFTDQQQAIILVNEQIKMCTAAVDKDNKQLVKPAVHVHPVIWQNCQRIIRGLSVQ